MKIIKIKPHPMVVIELRKNRNSWYWYMPYNASRTRFYYSKQDAIQAKEQGELIFDLPVNLPVHVCSF